MTKKNSELSNVRSNDLLCCPFCGAYKWEISFYEIGERSYAELNHEADCFFCERTRLFLPSEACIRWNYRAT